MSKSIGIDLGTTNSVAAIKKVNTEVLKNAEGEFITPSCITIKKKKIPFTKPEIIVGKFALDWIKQDPENTIVSVKRLMGRSFSDKEVTQIIKEDRLRYKITPHSRGTENSVAILLGKKEYTPEDISAEILKKIRNDAEKTLGSDVEYAVITVPAYFNDKQKHATRTAAALAGLKVRRLLPEPTAAAISFGVDSVKGDDAKTVLIFDFGGGTFDLSILTISGGQFIEQGKGGDMWLGGEDIDRDIATYVLEETAKEYEIQDIAEFVDNQDKKIKNRFFGELKNKVEKAKIRLSEETEAHVDILGILKDKDNTKVDVDVELTREMFEKIMEPVVEKTIKLTNKIIEDIHFTKDLIDNVLLVGGSSRIPCLINAMKKEFGDEKVMVHERPMLAIAEGAAILSHRLADIYECPGCGNEVHQEDSVCKNCEFDLEKYTIESGVFDIVHSSAHDYYIYLQNNEKHLFIEKNTPLPCEKTQEFSLVHEDQRIIHMRFVNIVNEQEESIGDLWLGFEPTKEDLEKRPDLKETLKLEITLGIDENNIIEVTAKIKERPDIKISKTLSRGKADEKLFLDLEKIINKANGEGFKNYLIIDLTHRSINIVKDINNIVNDSTGKINDSIFQKANNNIQKADLMLESGDPGITKAYYYESVIENFGAAIPPNDLKKLQGLLAHYYEAERSGTYEETLMVANRLDSTFEKFSHVGGLMELQKAAEITAETDPSKSPKFIRYIDDILKAFEKEDTLKAVELFQEIMPEAIEVVNSHADQKGIIHKDIKL